MNGKAPWVAEGLVTGLIGYGTVVVFFGLANLATGQPVFHTASLLGSALFFGARDPGAWVAGPGPVIAYNGVHILVSLCIGLGAAWLVFQTEKHRPLWFLIFFVALAGFIYSVVVMGVLASEIAHLLSWTLIVGANIVSGITAGLYLGRRHARLWGAIYSSDRR